jgi:hypothetical protein
MQQEIAAVLARYLVHKGFVYSGGIHGTASGMISSAFATEAFTSNHNRIRAGVGGVGGTAAINYSAMGAASNDTAWVVICAAQGNSFNNFSRVTGTNYFVDVVSTTQPTWPDDSTPLMKVTISGGNITAVLDLRYPASFVLFGRYDVTDALYGAVGDGITDDTSAFVAALAAYGSGFPNPAGVPPLTSNPPTVSIEGKLVFVPRGWYKVSSTLTVPKNTILQGQGMDASRILQFGNIDQIILSDNSHLYDLGLVGGGSLGYTGRGIVIPEGHFNGGYQRIERCRVEEHLNFCLELPQAADPLNNTPGAYLTLRDCFMGRYDGATFDATIREAVKLPNSDATGGIKRTFDNLITYGFRGIHLGGSTLTSVYNCRMGSIVFTANTSKCVVQNCRITGFEKLTGTENVVAGNIIGSNPNADHITLDANAFYCRLGPNAYGNEFTSSPRAQPLDSSGNNTNWLIIVDLDYAMPWKADTVDPVIGNGSIVSTYSREGHTVTWTGHITIGSTTTLGTGNWYFTPPFPAYPSNTTARATGTFYTTRDSVSYRIGVCRIISGAGSPGQLYCYTENQEGVLHSTVPAAWWIAGDTLDFTITYNMAATP